MSRGRWCSKFASVLIACSLTADMFVGVTAAEELLGAKKALESVQKLVEAADTSDVARLKGLIGELPARFEILVPADAAVAWIEVYDKWQTDYLHSQFDMGQTSIVSLVDVLPPPAAWPELGRLIDARPVEGSDPDQIQALALRMLGHRLNGQMELLNEDIKRALKLVDPSKSPKNQGGFFEAIGRLFQSPDMEDYWKQAALERVQRVKAVLDPASEVERFRSQLESPNLRELGSLSVPDLVHLVGREEATLLLEQALLRTPVVLSFDSLNTEEKQENETMILARQVAKEHLKDVLRPQWDLCRSIDAVDLFEAFAAMPRPDNDWSYGIGKQTAAVWYLMGLIVVDRNQDVLKFLADQQEGDENFGQGILSIYEVRSILPKLELLGHAAKVHAFLKETLKTNPELPLWRIFIESSARQGQSKEMLAMVEEAIADQSLLPQVRQSLKKIRADALLAADRVDDAIAQYLKLFEEDPESSHIELALRIAEIGRLVDREEWVAQGTDLAEQFLKEESNSRHFGELVGILIDVKQWARAERVCINALAEKVGDEEKNQNFHRYYSHESPLNHLLRVYHAAGRAADAVALLEEAPWWGQTDIALFLNGDQHPTNGHGERQPVPVPLIAARSLATVGRKDEALRIAKAMVVRWPGYDPGWQLLLELTGDEFVPLAEQVFARDAFEERPLIWLGKYYLDQGDFAKAEKLAKQAIAIDPSDGEQGSGDRMRVYGILAEALKRDDSKTAAVYQGAVKAIRLAESADQYYAAGMLSRGVRMYRSSLLLFADAYCIQSRLAVQLAEAGDFEGAAKHYQRAFELMPDSFGRVESHCFGCEGVFKGPLAEKIANQVFSKLVIDQPNNPRVHYLLGYLRQSEGRNAVALKAFREAVRLDPDYLNAWDKLLTAADKVGDDVTQDERDQAIFEILRLDPSGKHVSADVSKVHDLSRLWTVLHENRRRLSESKSVSLFELTAAKKSKGKIAPDFEDPSIQYESIRQAKFSSHQLITEIANLMMERANMGF